MDIVDMAQNQIQNETIALTLSRINKCLNNIDWRLGPTICEECGETIPDKRRKAVPGTKYCRECAEDLGI